MKKPQKPAAKSKPLYVRLRPEDFDRCEAEAWSQKKLISEWAREIILAALESRAN
jgi:hypothetical protein